MWQVNGSLPDRRSRELAGLGAGSLSAVSGAPATQECAAACSWRGASDTALRHIGINSPSRVFVFRRKVKTKCLTEATMQLAAQGFQTSEILDGIAAVDGRHQGPGSTYSAVSPIQTSAASRSSSSLIATSFRALFLVSSCARFTAVGDSCVLDLTSSRARKVAARPA